MGNIDLRDPNIQVALMVTLVAITIGHVFFLTEMLPFGYQKRGTEISNLEREYETLSADLMKAKQTASRLPQVRAFSRQRFTLERDWKIGQAGLGAARRTGTERQSHGHIELLVELLAGERARLQRAETAHQEGGVGLARSLQPREPISRCVVELVERRRFGVGHQDR